MATLNFFRPFKTNLIAGEFDFTSDSTCTVTVALTNSAPAATYEELSEITQITYTSLSSRVVTNVSQTESGGVVSFNCDDLTLTASGSVGPFRYVVLYDDDATNDKLIGWYDLGSSITLLENQTLAIDFTTDKFATLT
jgi:hypothetical protein